MNLAVKLSGQRFVRGEDDGGALGLLDHLGHRIGLTGPSCAQQNLILFAIVHTRRKLGNGCGLVARRFELAMHNQPDAALQFGARLNRGSRGVEHRGLHQYSFRLTHRLRFCARTSRRGAKSPVSRRQLALPGGDNWTINSAENLLIKGRPMRARIYQPARTAMSSGTARTRNWGAGVFRRSRAPD